jgi:hypothetical protein
MTLSGVEPFDSFTIIQIGRSGFDPEQRPELDEGLVEGSKGVRDLVFRPRASSNPTTF